MLYKLSPTSNVCGVLQCGSLVTCHALAVCALQYEELERGQALVRGTTSLPALPGVVHRQQLLGCFPSRCTFNQLPPLFKNLRCPYFALLSPCGPQSSRLWQRCLA